MIRSEHSIVTYDFVNRLVVPDRLLRKRDAVYINAAQECLVIYRTGASRVRQDLHRDVEDCLSTIVGCPPRRIASFCKLLDDAGEFATSTGKAAALRKRVFSLAAEMHPIVERPEGIFENQLFDAQAKIANALGISWLEIEDRLFADVIELQKLKQFSNALTPTALLSRYNLAQTQAALYRAVRVHITAFAQAPFIIRHVKLAGLMHRVKQTTSPGSPCDLEYQMILDGPVSSLRESTRYGIGFAKLLPALLACDNWCLTADILGPKNQHFTLRLTPLDRLVSETQSPAEFDSDLEQRIAGYWESNPVDGWRFTRNHEFLVQHQQIFTPDFTLVSITGIRIHIEVVGFWTPEYLREKHQRLKQFACSSTRSSDRWLLMFDRPPTPSKKQCLQDLDLPIVVITKTKKPQDWINAALNDVVPYN